MVRTETRRDALQALDSRRLLVRDWASMTQECKRAGDLTLQRQQAAWEEGAARVSGSGACASAQRPTARIHSHLTCTQTMMRLQHFVPQLIAGKQMWKESRWSRAVCVL